MIINWLTEHAKDSTKYLRSAAKEDFEKACNISSDLREARGFKIRIALRCRAVIDKLFIEGANQYELYTQEKLHAAIRTYLRLARIRLGINGRTLSLRRS